MSSAGDLLRGFLDKNKTFRPKKKFEPGTVRYDLHKRAKASLGAGKQLQDSVRLPPGEDVNEWLAVHVVDFFNRINLIYGTLSDVCTVKSCPRMTAGPKYEYFWKDEHNPKYKSATTVSTPEYVDLLMTWIEGQINNETIFPPDVNTPFPKDFKTTCKNIFKRLVRVFAHVYIHHFDAIVELGAEAHINACFKHFYFFTHEFNLVDDQEYEPLMSLVQAIVSGADASKAVRGPAHN